MAVQLRERIFDAVGSTRSSEDPGELSPREIERQSEIRRTDELGRFLGQLYNRDIENDDVVTVIRFSQILSGPVAPTFLGENDLF